MSQRFASPPGISRNAVIASGVVVFHVAILWAMQAGLLRRAVEVIVPASVLSEFIEPPQPKVAPTPPPSPAPPTPPKRQVIKAPPPAPRPLAIADPTPAPNAPVGVTEPQPPAPPISAPVAPPAPPAPAPTPAPPAPPAVQLPSSDADYLRNPLPPYPPISKRLGEQGVVLLRVQISTEGLPLKVEVKQSSGFERLDQAAVNAVQKWRFVPGKRNGVVETMSYNLPVRFNLE